MEDNKKDIAQTPKSADTETRAVVPTSRMGPTQTDRGDQNGQNGEASDHEKVHESTLRLVAVRNLVLFPHNVMPLTSGKELPEQTLERAMKAGARIGIVSVREGGSGLAPGADLRAEDLHEVGTEARIQKIVRFPDQSLGAVVQGVRRFRIQHILNAEAANLIAKVSYFSDAAPVDSLEMAALGRGLKQLVQRAIQLSPNMPNEASLFIENVQDPVYLSDLVVPYLSIEADAKQELLEIEDVGARLRRVHFFLTREIEILEMSQKIHAEVRLEVGKQQRKYYVREQLKLLQKELGELDGRQNGAAPEPDDLKSRVERSAMPKEAREAALREVDRIGMMQPGSPEHMVSFTYVNWLLDVPWGAHSQSRIDLKAARRVLDDDHFGLEKVKRRILEFLAVFALRDSLKGPIVLLVGPPGVGKTSLGRSVAKALGRSFVRIALGGVRDEAEIRGHRRTYIGSMPGKIVDGLKKAGSMDPVILLDEVDKLASDGRGDPAAALLEVLDSEQNHAFVDHYLGVPVDLSRVLFIATANALQSIPGPLRDRMEVIELSGYTPDEKSNIALKHLLPQVVQEHGLDDVVELKVSDDVLRELIQTYTREAGVRQLRRELAAVARNVARDVVEGGVIEKHQANRPKRIVTRDALSRFLGPAPFPERRREDTLPIGVATGLAYTPVGGDVLYIETALNQEGHGRLSLTGQLGDVMKESVQTALAYIRANRAACGVPEKAMHKADLHVHFPAGAVRKDGPSAGVAVFLAMVSRFSGREVPADLAVTGEISLRGEVLPVGGIKEKLIAAHRHGLKRVLIPEENMRDLDDLPSSVRTQLSIIPLKSLAKALEFTFAPRVPAFGETQGQVIPLLPHSRTRRKRMAADAAGSLPSHSARTGRGSRGAAVVRGKGKPAKAPEERKRAEGRRTKESSLARAPGGAPGAGKGTAGRRSAPQKQKPATKSTPRKKPGPRRS